MSTIYGRAIIPIKIKPKVVPYLTFSSPNEFTLSIADNTKHWDGALEWTDGVNPWALWDGTSALSSSGGKLYMRGTGNTVITGSSATDTVAAWKLTGSNISCDGNIETLLDYGTVASGSHPRMGDHCFRSLFRGCTNLTQSPNLPATTLANYCYNYMFRGCTSLTQAPNLPATTLAGYCYYGMFRGCTSLTSAPSLPATTLANYCYNYMFRDCTSLTQAPSLPATTLADSCYNYMFQGCTSLTQAPSLPATTLADSCYRFMFYGCTGLTQAPSLPATTLAVNCYYSMFSGCTKIKVSTTRSSGYSYAYRIPKSGTGTTATSALSNMFVNTGGTFTGTPTINTTYYMTTQPIG